MRRSGKTLLFHLCAAALAVVFMFPFLLMVLGSFDAETKYSITLANCIPRAYTLGTYLNVLSVGNNILVWLRNSLIISVIPTLTALFICPLLGYIFAKKTFRGKTIVFWYFMMAIMVPYQATIISNYLVYNALHWINTYWAFLIPGAWSVIYMFMMRQYIASLPDALIEAAKIDGAGEWQVFLCVIYPLCGPALSTVAIFTFMNHWNNFMSNLVFATSEKMYNLVVGLATLNQKTASFNMQMTAAVITCLPIFVVYLFLQRYFIEGMVAGGVKG